jgi:hypothetical protein
MQAEASRSVDEALGWESDLLGDPVSQFLHLKKMGKGWLVETLAARSQSCGHHQAFLGLPERNNG